MKFKDARVAAIFRAYPAPLRARLMVPRDLVFDVAAKTGGGGALQENLKWGQPSYLTAETGSGTTVRIDRIKASQGRYAMYFHCRSGLIETFREFYPDSFVFEGKRAIVFEVADRVPVRALRHCIGLTLTRHLCKKSGKTA
jgi:hypothetical protein